MSIIGECVLAFVFGTLSQYQGTARGNDDLDYGIHHLYNTWGW